MAATREAQFVTFNLGEQVFAVPVEMVREILDHEPTARIPNGPDYLLGLRDVRGKGVPTLDLRVKLGMSPTVTTPHTRVLVLDLEIEGRALTLGLVADRVSEVLAINRDAFEPAPDIGVSWRSSYIEGVVRRDNGFVVVIDIGELLSSEDARMLALPASGRAA